MQTEIILEFVADNNFGYEFQEFIKDILFNQEKKTTLSSGPTYVNSNKNNK